MATRPSKKKSSSLQGKRVLLGITGSIAVYKACDLVRRLKEKGADVRCLMTESAQKFVTPLTFGALSGHPVSTEMWDSHLWKMGHLQFSDDADLFLVAPVSAHTLAKLAAGMAGDVVCATALAVRCRKLLAPAMYESMWLHPATQANVRRLKGFGYRFAGPEWGDLSQGRPGWGRFAETAEIVAQVENILGGKNK